MEKTGTDIFEAANVIKNSGLVVFPTETVYGLGANALDPVAVKKIFDAKERPSYDPLIVHIDSIDKIDMITSSFPVNAKILADNFWPGPLTMILPKKSNVPDLVTSNLPSVGVRIPNHPTTLEFLKETGLPIAGPSANKFGYISPTKSSHLTDLLPNVDYILEGGECRVGIESTIISLVNEPVILRKGIITKEEIERLIGPVSERVNSSSNPEAPGMLKKHYAPKTKLEIYNPEQSYSGNIAFITFGDKNVPLVCNKVVNLSESGDYKEAAERIYATLRDLDHMDFDLILTSYLPDEGVGKAINDKLKRASC